MSDVMQNNSDSHPQTLGDFPFQQEIVEGKIERFFPTDVDDEELKWHFDEKDRLVTVIESGGWQLQMDNNLPNKIEDGQKIFIPKFVWHKVIKGDKGLKVSIEEFD